MTDILHIDQRKREELYRMQARTAELEPLLGLERNEQGISLNKTAITNSFAARRLEQIRTEHPAEWAEYCELTAQEMDLMDELGITKTIMDELFPDEANIDFEALLQENPLHIVK